METVSVKFSYKIPGNGTLKIVKKTLEHSANENDYLKAFPEKIGRYRRYGFLGITE